VAPATTTSRSVLFIMISWSNREFSELESENHFLNST